MASEPPHQQTGLTEEEEDSNFLLSMSGKMKQKPKLLKESTGTEVCCVFRVPQSLANINEKAYLPLIVSIGPYHHNGGEQLKAVEEQKWRYLDVLISRVQRHGVNLDTLFNAALSMEDEIRNCYSEAVKLEKRKLAELMVLDGCFVIELFCRATKVVKCEDNDPIFRIPWFLPYVLRDLLRLENQIPFAILEKIYDSVKSGLSSGGGEVPSVMELALKFFNRAMGRDEKVIEKYYKLEDVKHLLDLFCLSFKPINPNQVEFRQQVCNCLCLSIGCRGERSKPLQTRRGREGFYSAMKLRQAGIEIEIRENSESFLDIKFVKGVLQVPRISIDDFTASVFLNAIAFEQSYIYREDYFTNYANFMGRLINTPDDVDFLRGRGILENSLGTDDEVVEFLNTVCKDVVIDSEIGYLQDVFQGIEKYRGLKRAKLHAWWAELWDKYFGSPWAPVSFLGAVAVLALTATQVYYAIHPKKQSD